MNININTDQFKGHKKNITRLTFIKNFAPF